MGIRQGKMSTVAGSRPVNGDSSNGSRPSNGRSRSATGPRTPAGKDRSSRNATRHGIFSTAALVTGESPEDYKLLLRGLRKYWAPRGLQEEILVDKLASLFWRQRRVPKAESAEINKTRDFLLEDDRLQKLLNSRNLANLHRDLDDGIVDTCANPLVLDRAIALLTDLRHSFETNGLEKEHIHILGKLYGHVPDTSPPEGFVGEFIASGMAAKAKPGELGDVGMTPEEAREHAIACVEHEIRRLRQLKEQIESVESKRQTYTAQAMLVPNEKALDRLQRYEAHLSREIDRTLSQLERLQRMRLGHAVPPPLKVKISG